MSAGTKRETTGALWWLKPWCWEAGLRARDIQNGRVANLLSMAWGLSYVGATALTAFLKPAPLAEVPIIAAPLIAGYFALHAYRRFLGEADELLRKIHLEALAFGAAAAMAVGTTFLIVIPLGVSAVWGLALTLAVLCVSYSFRVAVASKAFRE